MLSSRPYLQATDSNYEFQFLKNAITLELIFPQFHHLCGYDVP